MGQDQSQEEGTKNDSPKPTAKNQKRRASSASLKQRAKIEDIIVVKDSPDAPSKANVDETIARLRKLKITYPIIKNIGGVPIEGLDMLPGLNPDPMTEMLLRYQYHLTECAEAVAFDQNAISKRMKEVEHYSTSVLKDANAKQKSMEQSFIDMQKFFEIDSLIDRISKNMDKTIKLMQNLNQMLPEDKQFSAEELDVKGKSLVVN
eukprot:Seg700.3 transcript_id=Seg700.3/GoldUCD/mRNA.D3Y31 product="BLOC-1-related complex subunit 5" protein_id=Seg700.3/GoldUCD/D3Y31